MESMGLYEAKSKLSALCEKARNGRQTVITRNGRPIAKIVPADEIDHTAALHAVQSILAFRGKYVHKPSTPAEIASWIRGARR